MGCLRSLAKIMVFSVNLVLFAVGSAMSIFAGLTYRDLTLTGGGDASTDFASLSVLLQAIMVFGVLLAVVSFSGCCGAFFGNSGMLYFYSAVMTLLLLFSLGIAGVGFFYGGAKVRSWSNGLYENFLREYGSDDQTTAVVDALQHNLQCCGGRNYKDWRGMPWNKDAVSVPDSCCEQDVEGCGKGALLVPLGIYVSGCLQVMEEAARTQAVMAIILAVVMLSMVFFSCFLARKSSKRAQYF